MSDLKVEGLGQIPFQISNSTTQQRPDEFSQVIKDAIHKVNRLDKEADRSIMDLLKGKGDVHETMISLQKVDISMRLLLTIRNKAIDAYKEVIHNRSYNEIKR